MIVLSTMSPLDLVAMTLINIYYQCEMPKYMRLCEIVRTIEASMTHFDNGKGRRMFGIYVCRKAAQHQTLEISRRKKVIYLVAIGNGRTRDDANNDSCVGA